MGKSELEERAEGYATLYYIDADGKRKSAGEHPIKKEAFQAGFALAVEMAERELSRMEEDDAVGPEAFNDGAEPIVKFLKSKMEPPEVEK